MGARTLEEVVRHIQSRSVIQPDGCWHWTGALNSNGYAHVSFEGRPRLGHRLVYIGTVGPVPDELDLDHVCHNKSVGCPGGRLCRHRACVNPSHLDPVSRGDNSRRSPRSNKARCAQGHLFDEENTYRRRGRRHCRACNRDAQRRCKAQTVKA